MSGKPLLPGPGHPGPPARAARQPEAPYPAAMSGPGRSVSSRW